MTVYFHVEPAEAGGYFDRSIGHANFTEADTLAELHANIRAAVNCHFEEGASVEIVTLPAN